MKKDNKKIQEFFDDRADNYDKVHLGMIDGGIEGKKIVADFIPHGAQNILDLGSGTGLELEYIFLKFPKAKVLCVDISDKMLTQLKIKFKNFNIETVCKDYFEFDFGKELFDSVVSVMSFHHFSVKEKKILYSRIFDSLKPSGVFVNCDFMVHSKEEMNKQLKLRKMGQDFDIPCTVKIEIKNFKKAGFKKVESPWGIDNTVLVLGKK